MMDNSTKTLGERVTMEPTRDSEWMQSVLVTLDDTGFRDDTHPEKRDIRRWLHPLNSFLRFKLDEQDMGFICFAHKGQKTLELHPCFHEQFRGAPMQEAGKQAIDWALLETEAEQVTTFGLNTERTWRHAAIGAGFRELYRMQWPNLVKGQPAKMVYYGISVDEWFSQSANRVEDFQECPVWIAESARHLFPFFEAMGSQQPWKAMQFWNRNAAQCNLPPVTHLCRRGDADVFQMGGYFFELHPEGAQQIGLLQQ